MIEYELNAASSQAKCCGYGNQHSLSIKVGGFLAELAKFFPPPPTVCDSNIALRMLFSYIYTRPSFLRI
jgi:hypothetical protein